MITTIICEECGCETEYEEYNHVRIDEEKVKQNAIDGADFENEFETYITKMAKNEIVFKERIAEHNAKCRWWNLKTEWFYKTSYDTIQYIREVGSWSWECIDKAQFFKPYYQPFLTEYITCPVCKHKHYFR